MKDKCGCKKLNDNMTVKGAYRNFAKIMGGKVC
jgi:hypothetical protein